MARISTIRRSGHEGKRLETLVLASQGDDGSLNVTLPYPPSVNRMYRAINGRQILSREGREYKMRVGHLIPVVRPPSGNVIVELDVYRPRKIGDLDNAMKAVFDALKGVAYVDDSQVVSILATRFDDKDNPRVEVKVSEVSR